MGNDNSRPFSEALIDPNIITRWLIGAFELAEDKDNLKTKLLLVP